MSSSYGCVYRGYLVHTLADQHLWSARADPFDAGFPILSQGLYEGHDSRDAALQTIKRDIDRLLVK
jgi:hypothetical protein